MAPGIYALVHIDWFIFAMGYTQCAHGENMITVLGCIVVGGCFLIWMVARDAYLANKYYKIDEELRRGDK